MLRILIERYIYMTIPCCTKRLDIILRDSTHRISRKHFYNGVLYLLILLLYYYYTIILLLLLYYSTTITIILLISIRDSPIYLWSGHESAGRSVLRTCWNHRHRGLDSNMPSLVYTKVCNVKRNKNQIVRDNNINLDRLADLQFLIKKRKAKYIARCNPNMHIVFRESWWENSRQLWLQHIF